MTDIMIPKWLVHKSGPSVSFMTMSHKHADHFFKDTMHTGEYNGNCFLISGVSFKAVSDFLLVLRCFFFKEGVSAN
jgi:hypothetical protein